MILGLTSFYDYLYNRAICFFVNFLIYYFSAFLIIFIIKRVRGG